MVLVVSAPNIAYDENIGPIECVACPNCSRMFTTRDVKGERYEIPSRCRRCGSPMNEDEARKFAAAEAAREHNPALAALGKRTRKANEGAID